MKPIWQDFKPARLLLPAEHDRARVIMTKREEHTGEVLIYAVVGSQPKLIYRANYVDISFPTHNTDPYVVHMEDESEVQFLKLGGCGCKDALNNIPLAHDLEHDVYPQ